MAESLWWYMRQRFPYAFRGRTPFNSSLFKILSASGKTALRVSQDALAERGALRMGTYDEYSLRALSDYPLPHLLRFEDRSAMAFGLESRTPFTDHRVVEFGLSLPLDYVAYKGWSKWGIRNILSSRIPEQVTWRREKVGFETPEQHLVTGLCNLINEQSGWCQSNLKSGALNEMLKRSQDSKSDAGLFWRLANINEWSIQWGK